MEITIWVLAVSCLIVYFAMGVVLHPLGLKALRLQLTYSGRQFEQIYQRWTGLQKRRYALHFRLDYAFLVLYGLLGYLVATALLTHSDSPTPFVNGIAPFVMPGAAAADAIENMLHQRLIREASTGNVTGVLALVAGVAATTKWVLIGVFVLFLVSA